MVEYGLASLLDHSYHSYYHDYQQFSNHSYEASHGTFLRHMAAALAFY